MKRKRFCTVEGCGKKHYAKELCQSHYEKMLRKINPNPNPIYRKRGTGSIDKGGYLLIYFNGAQKREHVLLAERALGRPLPKGAEVHHVDGNKINNGPWNLVVCPDRSYHKLLEIRTKALKGCGNPNYQKCWMCQKWDDPKNLYYNVKGLGYHHDECRRVYERARTAKRRKRLSINEAKVQWQKLLR